MLNGYGTDMRIRLLSQQNATWYMSNLIVISSDEDQQQPQCKYSTVILLRIVNYYWLRGDPRVPQLFIIFVAFLNDCFDMYQLCIN